MKIGDLEQYCVPNKEATWYDKEEHKLKLKRIEGIRTKKAIEESKKESVPVEKIVEYINEFLNVYDYQDTTLETFELDGTKQEKRGNVLYVKGLEWTAPKGEKYKIIENGKEYERYRYTYHDKKYDEIQKKFDLKSPNDIVWLKFTKDGYLGVVAASFDINYSYEFISGQLLKILNPTKEWDESFVIIVPINKNILKEKTRNQIETGIGNYLIQAKNVPIIDYYSHNNF